MTREAVTPMCSPNVDQAGIDMLERELGDLSSLLTDPNERECLFCYVYRMLELGCRCDLSWAVRWRDLRAPRATALVRRLTEHGGHCDCEIFMNGWRPAVPLVEWDDDLGLAFTGDYPERMPACPGIRAGSTQPCPLWVPKQRPPVRH